MLMCAPGAIQAPLTIGVVLMGTLTAVGGGVVRDVLVGERPAVLYKGFYATAALFGAGVLVVLDAVGLALGLQLVAAAGTCSSLRFIALVRNLRLPRTSLASDANV